MTYIIRDNNMAGFYFDTSQRYIGKSGKQYRKGVWKTSTGKLISLGNRIRQANGNYIQLNSDGTITTLYNAKTRQFTKGNNGKLLVDANTVNNIKANHIYQNGSWRRNTNNKLNKDTGVQPNKNIYKSTVDNKWHFFNSNDPVTWVNGKALNSQQVKQHNQHVQQANNKKDPWSGGFLSDAKYVLTGNRGNPEEGIGARFAQALGARKGSLVSEGADLVSSFLAPVAAINAVNSFRHGDIENGLLNTAFALPGVGMLGKALNVGSKAMKGINATTKAGHYALNGYMGYLLANTGATLHNYNKQRMQAANGIRSDLLDLQKSGYNINQLAKIDTDFRNMVKEANNNTYWKAAKANLSDIASGVGNMTLYKNGGFIKY